MPNDFIERVFEPTALAHYMSRLHECDQPDYSPIDAHSPEWIAEVRNLHGNRLHSSPPEHDTSPDTRKSPREVIQEAHPIPASVLQAFDAGIQKITQDDVRESVAKHWLHKMRLIFFGGVIKTTTVSAFFKLLPFIWAMTAQYTELNECRNFAAQFKTICIWLGINAVIRTLDEEGHHSYIGIVLIDDDTGDKVTFAIEPQVNRVVEKPYPKHGYTGIGWGETQ